MFDVEFLRIEKPQIRSCVLHTYREGVYRAAVRDRMKAISDQREWVWRVAETDTLSNAIWAAGIYGESVIAIGLDMLRAQPHPDRDLAELANAISQKGENRFFLQGDPQELARLPAWEEIVQASSILTEPEVTHANIPLLVEILGADTAVPVDRLSNRNVLDQALRTWVGRGAVSLSAFRSMLDLTSLVCVSQETRSFDLIAFEALTRTQARTPVYQWHDALARFLQAPEGGSRTHFLRVIDDALNRDGSSSRAIVALLFRVTMDLATVNQRINPEGKVPDGWGEFRWRRISDHKQIAPPKLLRWQILFAQAEAKLTSGGLVVWKDLLESVAN